MDKQTTLAMPEISAKVLGNLFDHLLENLKGRIEFKCIYNARERTFVHTYGTPPTYLDDVIDTLLPHWELVTQGGATTEGFEAVYQLGDTFIYCHGIAQHYLLILKGHKSEMPLGMVAKVVGSKLEMLDRSMEQRITIDEQIALTTTTTSDWEAGKAEERNESIMAAARTQSEILGDRALLSRFLPKNTLVFQPKDFISGDFYWFRSFDDTLVIAVGDCTGHSLEGAMMTVMGTSLLRLTVTKRNKFQPGAILEILNEHIAEASSGSSVTTLGMEMGLLVVDKKLEHVSFSCAGIGLLQVFPDGTSSYVRENRKGLGMVADGSRFQTLKLNYQKGVRYYLYSDGVKDQFGGDKARKIGNKRVESYLTELVKEPMDKQDALLTTFLRDWQGDTEQTDDMTILGVELD